VYIYIYVVYGGIFDDVPAVNAVSTPNVYMVLANLDNVSSFSR